MRPYASQEIAPLGWFDYAIPTINQHGPSCCGQAWANWFEMMLRKYVGTDCLAPGESIDGYAIWQEGCNIFNSGNMSGGLLLRQGFYAMRQMGILPPDAQLLSIDPTMEAINAQLKLTPLVQGHIVSEGWYDPNPENGCLDHTKLPKPGDGGHATCLMGQSVDDGIVFPISQNSWGTDYGWKGYFLMTADFWNACYLGDGPCTATMPKGWETWTGWKKFVTRSPE